MIKRTLVFTTPGTLRTKYHQLIWRGEDEREASIPIEDIGFLLLESPQIMISTAALQNLTEAAIAVIICDASHLPAGYLLPYRTHTLAHRLLIDQIALTEAKKNRLWQQIIIAKIKNQASIAHIHHPDIATTLAHYAMRVQKGDPDNLEAQAARLYFRLFEKPNEPFRRDRFGEQPNPALNYGYAILRAAIARALVCSGLDPSLGLRHSNKYNHFCLADDIIEPYRPAVDRLVLDNADLFFTENDIDTLTPPAKRELLTVLTHDITIGGIKRPLMNALTLTTASLARCISGTAKEIELPSFS